MLSLLSGHYLDTKLLQLLWTPSCSPPDSVGSGCPGRGKVPRAVQGVRGRPGDECFLERVFQPCLLLIYLLIYPFSSNYATFSSTPYHPHLAIKKDQLQGEFWNGAHGTPEQKGHARAVGSGFSVVQVPGT